MRLSSKAALTSVMAFLMVSPALADAKTDSLQLRKTVVDGLYTYIELGENSEGRSKALGVEMEDKVKVPVAKAQSEWREIAQNSTDQAGYQTYKMCDTAPARFKILLIQLLAILKATARQEPDYEATLTKFGADLTECEKALDVQLTF